MMTTAPRILLTGATGYVGGRLLTRLVAAGYKIRCLARNPEFLADRGTDQVQVAQGDVLDPATLRTAFQDMDVCFYLVHSMGQAKGFEALDRQAATAFGQAARAAGVSRIIYLGGLGDEADDLSPHLRSRQEVGRILRDSGVLTLELRASIVIGSGSLSFEMIRSLTEKLPVMVTPQWVNVEAQPIGIEDLLQYLVDSVEIPLAESRVVEIGGPDAVTYRYLMAEYARIRGLKRLMVPVPVLTPGLSSLWLGLVTPLFARIGRKLIDSIRHATVITQPEGQKIFAIQPMGISQAMELALRNEDKAYAETRWSDSIASAGLDSGYGGLRLGNRLVDSRVISVDVPPEQAFEPIAKIGGENGWYAYNWLWALRGSIDLLVGGVGMRRRRPDNRSLRPGDSLDFWRVEVFKPPHHLKLRAEMKVPGKAWLEFEVQSAAEGSTIRQTAVFLPKGLSGLLYWYGIYPVHALVFGGMIRAIGRRAGPFSSEPSE